MEHRANEDKVSCKDAHGRLTECIHRDQRILVGTSHLNKRGKPRMEMLEALSNGTNLVLIPEPDNQFDSNAILVYRADDLDDDIGYIDAAGAKKICALLDRGATFQAEVSWIDRRNAFLKVYVYVFQMTAPTLARRPPRPNAIKYSAEVLRRPRLSEEPRLARELREKSFLPVEDVGILRRLLNFLSGS